MAINHVIDIKLAIDYMERNLDSDISLEKVADEVGLSKFYFHRVFKSWVGESASEYLRKRRLTRAAQDLRESEEKIYDVAIRYQFGSQEAFTRAFKSMFGLTPGEYRERSQCLFIEKSPLTPEKIQVLKNAGLTPRFRELKDCWLIGVECSCSFVNNRIGELWNELEVRLGELNLGQPVQFVGAYKYLPHVGFSYSTEFSYLAGFLWYSPMDIPEGMVGRCIPAARYAVFSHDDILFTREESHQYIIGTWLPKSECIRAQQDTLEVFESKPAEQYAKYEIYLPVVINR